MSAARSGEREPLLVADTSTWHRSDHPEVARRWREELVADRVAATPPMRLEVLYSARSESDLRAIALELDGLRQVPCGSRAFARAEEVQRRLAERGGLHHRSVKLVDLLIAAAAEAAEATVWHYDEDYDRIAAVTGQPTEWVARRGSLHG